MAKSKTTNTARPHRFTDQQFKQLVRLGISDAKVEKLQKQLISAHHMLMDQPSKSSIKKEIDILISSLDEAKKSLLSIIRAKESEQDKEEALQRLTFSDFHFGHDGLSLEKALHSLTSVSAIGKHALERLKNDPQQRRTVSGPIQLIEDALEERITMSARHQEIVSIFYEAVGHPNSVDRAIRNHIANTKKAKPQK